MAFPKFENLEATIQEVEKLQSAYEILEKIYIELGPYNNVLSDDLNRRLRDYFRFDDSE